MHTHEGGLEWDLRDRLAKSLRVSGMAAVDMAVALGVHRNTVNNYLNGRTPIPRSTLIAWAFVCAPEVTVEWLEHGEQAQGPKPPSDGEALTELTQTKLRRTRHAGRANTVQYAVRTLAA